MCEAELWDDALIELNRQNYAPDVKKEEAAWLASIYLGMKRYEEVLDLQQRARADDCDITPLLAIAYARLGRLEEARVLAKEARDKHLPGAERAMGHVYFEAGDLERALYWYEEEARGWFDSASAMALAGKTLIALGDYGEAAAAYERALKMARFRDAENIRQLAECYRQTGRQRRAEELEKLAEEP